MANRINTDSLPFEDLLHRKQFAKELAKGLNLSLKNDEDSFVLGINGQWGSGKTTLVHYLKEELSRGRLGQPEYIFFDFNPWMFSGSDSLIAIFLDQLSRALPLPKLKQRVASLAGAMKYLDWVKDVNPTVGKIQQGVKGTLEKFGPKSSIQELKQEIDKIIVRKNLRIFIFIDDLDRLTPNEVVELFQIIKLSANFKNTIFIVAFDKEVVQEILQQRHGINGERYLEKIVQVDYRIPDPLDEVLQKIFFDKLREVLGEFNIKHDSITFRAIWTVHRLKYYFVTIRDIHRYFNALRLRLPAIKNEVDVYQFCVIEAIRIFDYSSYELIQRTYRKGVMFGPNSAASKAYKKIENENTFFLYEYLFKQPNHREIQFPISEPQYFHRYFALSVGMADVREETVQLFVDDRSSRDHILQTAQTDGSIRNLLTRLRTKNVELQAVNPLIRWKADTEHVFLSCITEYLQLLDNIMNSSRDFRECFNYLLSMLPGDDGHFNPAKFYLLAYLNDSFEIVHDNPFAKNVDVIANYRPELAKVEQDLLTRHQNDHLVFQRTYLKTDTFHKLFLIRFNSYFPEDYKKKLSTYFNTPNNVAIFLRFLIDADREEVNAYSVLKLLNTEILDLLIIKMEAVNVEGLGDVDKKTFSIFNENLEEVRKKFSAGEE